MVLKRIFSLVFCFFLLLAMPGEAMSRFSSEAAPISPNFAGCTLEYRDEARDRPLTVELWYPTAALEPFEERQDPNWVHPAEIRNAPLLKQRSKFPLIILSHGNRGDRRDWSWLAKRLVQSGFVVAAVDHHGNTRSNFNPLISLRFWERAKDISFVIDRLLAESMLKGLVDPNKIGFAGYSLGGLTGLALGGGLAKNVKEVMLLLQEKIKELDPEIVAKVDFSDAHLGYKDRRIKAILLICPAVFVYPSSSLEKIKVPVGLIAAMHDEILPHKEHAEQIIKHLIPAKLKVIQEKISHSAFLTRVTEEGKKRFQKALPHHPIHDEVEDFAVDFFQQHLK